MRISLLAVVSALAFFMQTNPALASLQCDGFFSTIDVDGHSQTEPVSRAGAPAPDLAPDISIAQMTHDLVAKIQTRIARLQAEEAQAAAEYQPQSRPFSPSIQAALEKLERAIAVKNARGRLATPIEKSVAAMALTDLIEAFIDDKSFFEPDFGMPIPARYKESFFLALENEGEADGMDVQSAVAQLRLDAKKALRLDWTDLAALRRIVLLYRQSLGLRLLAEQAQLLAQIVDQTNTKSFNYRDALEELRSAELARAMDPSLVVTKREKHVRFLLSLWQRIQNAGDSPAEWMGIERDNSRFNLALHKHVSVGRPGHVPAQRLSEESKAALQSVEEFALIDWPLKAKAQSPANVTE